MATQRVERIFELLRLATPEQRGEFLFRSLGGTSDKAGDAVFVTRLSHNTDVSTAAERDDAKLE